MCVCVYNLCACVCIPMIHDTVIQLLVEQGSTDEALASLVQYCRRHTDRLNPNRFSSAPYSPLKKTAYRQSKCLSKYIVTKVYY